MRTQMLRLGSLDCTLVARRPEPAPALVVLCHGYGASRHDLADLAPGILSQLPADAYVDFLFPEAPLSLGATGGREARAWWHLDVAYLQRRQTEGPQGARALQQETFAGLPAARRALRQTIEAAMQRANLGYDRVVLGGFSQGAMLTCDLTLSLEEAPAGLVVWSGTLIDEGRWRRLAARRAGLQVVQSHGRADPILPFAGATALRSLFEAAGMPVAFVAFDGGHTVPPSALAATLCLVRRLVKP